jgi:hypothetical protein
VAYRFLCGGLGLLLVLGGLVLFAGFFAYQAPGSEPAVPTGPVGFYFIGFAGSALVAWGGCLLGAARTAEGVRSVGTATAAGFVLCAVMRLTAWVVGDYHDLLGELPRAEAAFFLLAALALVWLRPQPGAEART